MEIIQLEGLKDILALPQKILITTHVRPDGDAIGSSMGLYHFLKNRGHSVQVVTPTSVPDFLMWMSEAEHIINFEQDAEKAQDFLKDVDLIFCLDFNRIERLYKFAESVGKSKVKKVVIDHHLNPDLEQFDFAYSNPAKSSTAEMIYDFILMMEGKEEVNMDVMEAIYTGMLTDTGSFRFPATNSGVHRIVAEFMDKGLKHAPIHETVTDTWSIEKMRFMGYLFDQKLKSDLEKAYAYIYIAQEDLEQHGMTIGDTEGLVNMIIGMKGIRVGVLITQASDMLKISFRSKGNIDVNKFAATHFDGGGHFNAAGASSRYSWEETEDIILKNLPKFIDSSLNQIKN